MPSKRIGSIAAVKDFPRSPTPSSFKSRLADFDSEDLAGEADRLLEVLGELRHSQLSVAKRYAALRECLAFAGELRSSLSKQLVGLSLPPPSEQISLSRRCAEAYRLMADGFRSMAESIAGRDIGPLSDANRLSRSCYWGITCLGDYVVIRCECYLKCSPGVWLNIHKLYDLAVSEGVEHLPLGKNSKHAPTVDGAYKRMLLLGLSDPFQHPFRGLRPLYEKLNDWASLTYLTTGAKPSTRCAFVVDPRLDRPATPALSQTSLRAELDQKWFITKELVTRLKRDYDRAIGRTVDHFQQHEPSADELSSIDFLRRMIVRWGIHPVRTGKRRKTYKTCDLVAGLRPVCRALNGFKPLNAEAQDAGPGLRRMIQGTYSRDDMVRADYSQVRDGWEIEDESDSGLKLVCRPSGSYGVGVDDVVAVKADHVEEWSVGTVHWAQTDESGNVALGVRLIEHTVRPVLIDRLHADAKRARSEALLLVDKSGGGMKRSLICPPSVYFPTGTYLVRLPGTRREFVVEATNILLSSRSYAWFEVVKPQADTTQKVLDLIQAG